MTAHLLDYASELLEVVDPDQVAPGFVERLRIAADPAGHCVPRTIATPKFLTDLGLRRSPDPAQFYALHLGIFDWPIRHDPAATLALIRAADLTDVARLLDATVLLFGDYDLACDAVTPRLAEIIESGDAQTAVTAGVLLAAVGDPVCLTLLERAAASATDFRTRFMASHRYAAAQIKRVNDPGAGLRSLDELDGAIAAAHNHGLITLNDQCSLTSVTANLRALGLLRLGRHQEAHAEVVRSRTLVRLEDLTVNTASESARYASQESMNIAQMEVFAAEPQHAVTELERNVAFCTEHAPEYLSEALAGLGYCLLKAQSYTAAASALARAITLIATEASPVRLLKVRHALAAALAKDGRRDAACRELYFAEQDPLGLSLHTRQGDTAA